MQLSEGFEGFRSRLLTLARRTQTEQNQIFLSSLLKSLFYSLFSLEKFSFCLLLISSYFLIFQQIEFFFALFFEQR
jgi:hypothetical protein